MKFWYKVIITISLILFLQILSPFLKEGLFLGHDSQLHSIYLTKFEEALKAGQFPVRWADWFVPGYNQPLFNFYQPGIYYIFQIPRLLGLGYIPALNVTAVTIWFISAILMYLFVKRHFGTLSGILSAFFYFLAPYHITDIFIRSALPEFTSLAFVPGIFWGLKGYFDTQKGFYLTLTSLFIALVMISHPPTLIMFSPLILAYIAYLFFLKKSLSLVFHFALSIVVGFGLISFFIIPAYFEQGDIQTIYLHSGYYDFHHHFICLSQVFVPFWNYGTSQTGCEDRISFQLGIVHWLAVLTTVAAIILRFRKTNFRVYKFLNVEGLNKEQYYLLFIFLGVFIAVFYLLFEISQPIWETLPYIPYIQYAFRFLIVLTFISSFFAGAILALFAKEPVKYGVFITLIVAATLAYGNYLKPAAYGTASEMEFGKKILHPSENLKNFDPEPGYMPKAVDILPGEDDRPKEEVKFLTLEGLATDSAKIDSFKLSAHKKEYDLKVNEESIARFYTHYYPGWKVLVNNTEYQPDFKNIYGYMDVALEPGTYNIKLILENTPLRSAANSLTVGFWVVAASFILIFNPSRSRKTKT